MAKTKHGQTFMAGAIWFTVLVHTIFLLLELPSSFRQLACTQQLPGTDAGRPKIAHVQHLRSSSRHVNTSRDHAEIMGQLLEHLSSQLDHFCSSSNKKKRETTSQLNSHPGEDNVQSQNTPAEQSRSSKRLEAADMLEEMACSK